MSPMKSEPLIKGLVKMYSSTSSSAVNSCKHHVSSQMPGCAGETSFHYP
jgi:hypothetical protein